MQKKEITESDQIENQRPFSEKSPAVQNDSSSGMSEMQMMEKLLHWAAIVESSDDAIISKSIDGHITSWNRGAEKLYGYTADEIIGKSVSVLMPPEKVSDFPAIMKQLRRGKKIDHYETKRKTKNGKVIDVSITVSPIKDSQGNVIGASKIARDISERIDYQDRREDFVSSASHELKTPLTTQKVYGELLNDLINKNGDTQYKPYIKKIIRQTAKLENLVNDLLQVSNRYIGKLELERKAFVIGGVLKETVSDLQQVSKHNIILKQELNTTVIGDKERTSQVLSNLLSNAMKYSKEGSEIIVTSELRGDMVVVSVRDFGIGIAKRHHKRIFEKFYRLSKSTYPGMGIGLNFCQEIISRLGGDIWVESERGKGSAFYFSLPVKKEE